MGGMIPFGKGYFHKGHYLSANPCSSLKRIGNPYYSESLKNKDGDDIGDYFSNAYVLLDGACYTFAYALHQELHYEVFEFRCGDSLHAFCKSTYKEQDVYIDARGATTSLKEFLFWIGHSTEDDYRICPYDDIEEDGVLDDDVKKMLYEFAITIIRIDEDDYKV